MEFSQCENISIYVKGNAEKKNTLQIREFCIEISLHNNDKRYSWIAIIFHILWMSFSVNSSFIIDEVISDVIQNEDDAY